MSIKRGYIRDQAGGIKYAWSWATDDPPSPYPDCLDLDYGDIAVEDSSTSADDWDIFRRNLGDYLYVGDIGFTLKPEMVLTLDTDTIPADGETIATISGIPPGTSAVVGDQSLTVDDGTFEMSFDMPGDYEVMLSHPNYLSPNPPPVIHAT